MSYSSNFTLQIHCVLKIWHSVKFVLSSCCFYFPLLWSLPNTSPPRFHLATGSTVIKSLSPVMPEAHQRVMVLGFADFQVDLRECSQMIQ
ncbi:hypothetical protein BgiBS90_013286, partial [Biomphalaria glabrata]